MSSCIQNIRSGAVFQMH